MQELVISLPDHKVKYLESMSKYIAETVSEIIEGLGYNHFMRHFEINDGAWIYYMIFETNFRNRSA